LASPTTNTPYFDPSIPKVCIVGRPNVGKSTLFNRLLGSRKAITDPTPGVTRDPIRSLWAIDGRPVVLLDTGGLTESKDYLDQLITQKSLKTAQDAQVLVLVLDVEEGVTAEDQEFIRRMRQFSDRIILAINKVDNAKREAAVWNFHSLGFKPVVGISSAHGLGLDDLVEAVSVRLEEQLGGAWTESAAADGWEVTETATDAAAWADEGEAAADEALDEGVLSADDPDLEERIIAELEDESLGSGRRLRGGPRTLRDGSPRVAIGADSKPAWDISIAILGQPNTGKSTLVNLLTGSELSLVSPVAGTTRDVIEGSFLFEDKVFRILDTAGIRRKARVTEDLEYYSVNRAIASIASADVVFLMIDAEKGLTDQDKKIAAQIVKEGRGVIMVLNKWDLMQNLPNQFTAVSDRIRYLFPVLGFAPILAISAQKGEGIGPLLKEALRLKKQLYTRVETARLNALLRKWVDHTPPPSTKGAMRWKLRYMTQISIHPLEFVLFANKSEGFPEAYLGHITNRLRLECGLKDVPLRIRLRSSGGRSKR
jgi:GTP-binding protein